MKQTNPVTSRPKLFTMRLLFVITIVSLIYACNGTESSSQAQTPATSQAYVEGPVISTKNYKEECESPDIRVQVEGFNTGMAYLYGAFADQNYRADSAAIDASGNMVFKNDEPYRPGMLFVVLPGNRNIQLLVDKDQTFTMKTNLNNLVDAMQVEGNQDNELLYQALKFENGQRPKFQANASRMSGAAPNSPEYKQLKAEQDQLLDERKAFLAGIFEKYPNTFFTSFKRAGQNPDLRNVTKPDGSLDTARYSYLYRMNFWNDVNFNDERLLYTPVLYNKLKRYIKELTPQHPDSINAAASLVVDRTLKSPEVFKFFANWITLNYDPKESTLMDAQAVFVHMIENYFTYDRAFWSDSTEVYSLQLRAHEMTASLVGKKGPNVTAKDPNGVLRSIYDLKAPYIIVYMYNPDCEHCAIETPLLVNFYNEWKSKGVDVYGIAIDTDHKKWTDYIAKDHMTWTNVYDPTNKAIYATYFVDVTPEIYVLNPDRIIIAKNLKVDQIQTMIERDMAKRKG
jgi:peroxiredoxin